MKTYKSMMNIQSKNILRTLIFIIMVSPVISNASSVANRQNKNPMIIYKSPSCGCCTAWVDHIKHAGFSAKIQHPQNINLIKNTLGVASTYQACHTASLNGYLFEGHIPATVIKNFLGDQPDALGLAVPGMPMGSPGMDTAGSFNPYHVLLLKKDGTSEVYATVSSNNISYSEVK
jgi:hypothetical protein